MDHGRAQDTQHGKGSMSRPSDGSASPTDPKRVIRRVRSPSRPRAWLSRSYQPKSEGRVFRSRFPKDGHSFYKQSFPHQKYHSFNPKGHLHQRDYFQPKLQHVALRDRGKEKERYELRESADGSSPKKQNSNTRPFLPRSTSSRDKDMHFSVCQSDRNHGRERDHMRTKSKDRERRQDEAIPSTASQTATRDRAIQQRRKEIDGVYYQESEMFGLVAKMLIAKDPTLESSIQSALQENLRDIGRRCVANMEKFIEDYDCRGPHH